MTIHHALSGGRRSRFRAVLALAALGAAAAAAALAAPATSATRNAGSAAVSRTVASPSLGVTAFLTFRVGWQQLLPKGSPHRLSAAELREGYEGLLEPPKQPLFRLLWADVTVVPSSAFDDGGGPCGWYGGGAFHPETCSRIHVRAHFTLTDPLGLEPVEPLNPPLWCLNVYDPGGMINHLRDPADCRGTTVTVGWPDAEARMIGALPVWTVEGSTSVRLDGAHHHLASIGIILSTSAGKPPCRSLPAKKPKPPKSRTRQLPRLDPSMGIYDALRKLSPKDERWDLLLRRVERQRAALRGKMGQLEEAGREAGLLYFSVTGEVAQQLLVGPTMKALGVMLKGGKLTRVARFACHLSPAQQERVLLENMRLVKTMRETQAKLMKVIGSSLDKAKLTAQEAHLVDVMIDLFGDLTRLRDTLR